MPFRRCCFRERRALVGAASTAMTRASDSRPARASSRRSTVRKIIVVIFRRAWYACLVQRG